MIKRIQSRSSGFSRRDILTGLIAVCCFLNAHGAPLPSSYGVWDRGDKKDFKAYPFLKGTACDAPWDKVEKRPGKYDWSQVDKAIEHACKNGISVYLSFPAGPSTPDWVYEYGVPKVVVGNDAHGSSSWSYYPYYLSPEYKKYYHRFLTEAARHTLTDAVFNHGGKRGADLSLVNADDQDDIFSLIEVYRGKLDGPVLIPPETVKTFPGSAKRIKYGKAVKKGE